MPIQMDQQFEEKPVRNIPWYYLFQGIGLITVGYFYVRKVPEELRPHIGIAFLGFVNIMVFGLILKICADLLRINVKAYFDTLGVTATHLVSFLLCTGLLIAYEWPVNVTEDRMTMVFTVAFIILVVDVFAMRHSFGLHFMEALVLWILWMIAGYGALYGARTMVDVFLSEDLAKGIDMLFGGLI